MADDPANVIRCEICHQVVLIDCFREGFTPEEIAAKMRRHLDGEHDLV